MTRALFLTFLLGAAACRATDPYRAPDHAFFAGRVEAAYAKLVADGKKGIPEEDAALWRCDVASAALCLGDEDAALKSLRAAAGTMGTLGSTSDERARAIFGEEATKTWKGDPYERCMNALYKGILYWRKGELGNASASFKRGLLADGWSEAGESQKDFAALMYLLGWVSALRGEEETARFHFKEAVKAQPGDPWLKEADPKSCNVVVVADVGCSPLKFADGPGGSIARFAARKSPDQGVEISVDGGSFQRSLPATDLYLQAITRGKRVLDGIRKGKAVFKAGSFLSGALLLQEGAHRKKDSLVAVGAGLLLLSLLTNAEADTRCWTFLPGGVCVMALAIPPGRHRLTVRALDGRGRPLPGWSADFEVAVPSGKDTLYYFRALGGRIFGLTDPPGAEKAPESAGTPLAGSP